MVEGPDVAGEESICQTEEEKIMGLFEISNDTRFGMEFF